MAEFDRFSPSARTALQFARAAAEHMNHPSIGTEHLLLGIVAEREDLAGYLLSLLGVTLKDVTRAIVRSIGMGDEPLLRKLDLTQHARIALETADTERQRLGHDQIRRSICCWGFWVCRPLSPPRSSGDWRSTLTSSGSSLCSMYESDGVRPPIGPVLERIRDAHREHGDPERVRTRASLSEDDVAGRARTVMRFARNIAHSLDHESVGTDHLLLGFVADRDCDAARVLSGFGLTEKRMTLAVRFARGLNSRIRAISACRSRYRPGPGTRLSGR